jgi:hypothetical protein
MIIIFFVFLFNILFSYYINMLEAKINYNIEVLPPNSTRVTDLMNSKS